jgi:hypothetical protein
VSSCPGLKRSCVKGIHISAVQPSSSTRVLACQTGSKRASMADSLSERCWWSILTPEAVTPKLYAVRRSRNVSSDTRMKSASSG